MGTNSWILETASHEPERQGNKAGVCPLAATRTRPPRLRGARAQLQRLRRSPRDMNGRPPRTRALTMAALRASCGLTRLPAAALAEPLKSRDPGLPQRTGRRGRGQCQKERWRTRNFRSVLQRSRSSKLYRIATFYLGIAGQLRPDSVTGFGGYGKKKKLNSSRLHK